MTARGEEGNITITAAGAIAALIALLLVIAVAARGVIAAHQAQVAAEGAALAGAHAAFDASSQPCERARETAERNGAELASCRVDNVDVEVRAEIRGRQATSRAGPV
ncbi:Rv3654c family TadE-like protein [Corynebacterium sp. H128]|uniref:Rv3654c family TadE-like protein n=1 Tax=unclassified Corynebacterium TaxID=2624378 RepID=UPI0030AF3916